MSRKTSDVFRTSFLTMDGTLDPNNSQLTFRALQAPLNTTDSTYFSLGAAQTTDPTIRLNKYDASGGLIGTGYIYDTTFNQPPPGNLLIVVGSGTPYPVTYSTNGQSWAVSQNGSALLTTVCQTVAFNGFTWLAGGSDNSGNNTVIYSSNGINWGPNPGASSLLTDSCTTIATDGILWIAGGIGTAVTGNIHSYMIYSYDGLTWTYNPNSYTQFTPRNITCIAQSADIWLAGSSSDASFNNAGNLYYSVDGLSWFNTNIGPNSPIDSYLIDNVYALCWNGSIWLAGGDKGGSSQLVYSGEGHIWNSTNPNSAIFTSVRTISWNGIIWTAGGYDASGLGHTLAYSYDGINWIASPSTNAFPFYCNSITWDGNNWIGVGIKGGGANGVVISTDGIIWNGNTLGTNLIQQGNVVCVNKALPFIAPGPPAVNNYSPLMIIGAISLIVNQASTIYYSTDGISWNQSFEVNNSFGTNSFILQPGLLQTAAWNGSIWVGGFIANDNSGNTVGYSNNGITWYPAETGNNGMTIAMYSTVWGESAFGKAFLSVGYGQNPIFNYTTNGYYWDTYVPNISQGRIICANDSSGIPQLAYNGTLWMATGAGTEYDASYVSIAYSSDGLSWTKSNSGSAIFTNNCSAITWSGSLWVAGGISSGVPVVGYSSDGIIWKQGTLHGVCISGNNINTITNNGSLFLIGSQSSFDISNNNLGYSYDGIDWYPVSPIYSDITILNVPQNTTITSISSITWNGYLWIAVGGQSYNYYGLRTIGIVLYSYNGISWNQSQSASLSFALITNIVATNRINPLNKAILPPPILNQNVTTSGGNSIYTTQANNLYKSSIMSLDETNGILGINQSIQSYTDLSDTPIQAALEISGGSVIVNTTNSVAGLYLTSHGSKESGGRIELYDALHRNGWRIDNNVKSGNHLQISNYDSSNQPVLAIDMSSSTTAYSMGIGMMADGSYNLSISGDVYVNNYSYISGTKSFEIDHPNPVLNQTHSLRHNCVEGPTRGENLYRWTLRTENRSCVQTLPSYSQYLNERWQFLVQPVNSFGKGYVKLSPCETFFTLTVNEEGTYSIIGIATRKDKAALGFDAMGVEVPKV